MNLEPFSYINPCGKKGMQMTQVTDYFNNYSINQMQNALAHHFYAKMRYNALEIFKAKV